MTFLAQPLAIRRQHQIEILGPSRAHKTTLEVERGPRERGCLTVKRKTVHQEYLWKYWGYSLNLAPEMYNPKETE